MKKILLIIFSIFATINISAGWTVFINCNGIYRPFNEETDVVSSFEQSEKCPKGSFNYYRSCLGYLSSEVQSFWSADCYFIALNVFNNDVIFVIPKDTTKTTLSKHEVESYLAEITPTEKDFVLKLADGVKEKTIRQSFVEKSLGIKSENNSIKDDIHGFTYTFKDGFLIDYQSDDGLDYDAKEIKTDLPSIFSKIQSNAQKHYGTSANLVAKYINGQCKYFRIIEVDYLKSATTSNIEYNYALLYSILYEGISLEEFLFLVPGAEISSRVNNYIVVSYGNFVFTFKDKKLIKNL